MVGFVIVAIITIASLVATVIFGLCGNDKAMYISAAIALIGWAVFVALVVLMILGVATYGV